MKKLINLRKTPRKLGFTLVELLVVIAIIAILAGVILSVGTTVLNIAKRTKAQNNAQQIQTSVLAYYTEYSVYPTASGVTADYTLDDTDAAGNWGNMIECLSGMISPTSGTNVSATETTYANSRQISFLNLKASDVGSTAPHKDAPLNNLPYSTTHLYFNMTIDADYSGVIGPSDTTVTNTLPNFAASPFATTGGSTTGGVAIWANCNQNNGTSANWYVHTY
jgi:prepilin-type N-terminal cleavage/methylation domain-containing protein